MHVCIARVHGFGANSMSTIDNCTDEGILKMYLRGHCLNLYAPTDIATDYDFSATLPEPEEQLKLEWVYP
ncbi:hypothetical protein ACTXT7_012186 [Hymenolepis weldensis]